LNTFEFRIIKLAHTDCLAPALETSKTADMEKGDILMTQTNGEVEVLDEHSEQARAPHTNGPKDVPRCVALSSSSKDAAVQGGVTVELKPLFATALVVRRRYFIVAPRPFPAAPLVVRRRCLIVVPKPCPRRHACT
jgi:hypothetical protein